MDPMSQALHENINVHNAGIGADLYPPDSAQNQALRGVSNFVDGSGSIFSMYLEMATEEDKKIVENWKADADGILIFTGLFSAAVASLISISIQDIQQNSQDISNFYLANTYQATINPNLSSSLPTSPPPFSPPNYAVWVNSLWLLSLVISLTCALLATFLQQWARRYLKVTQTCHSLHRRARIRAFFLKVSTSVSFRGRSRYCQHFSTFPCSYSSPASLCSYRTSISRFSKWSCHGLRFERLCTDASH